MEVSPWLSEGMKPSDVSIECETFDFVIRRSFLLFSFALRHQTNPVAWNRETLPSTINVVRAHRCFSFDGCLQPISHAKIVPSLVIVWISRAGKSSLARDEFDWFAWKGLTMGLPTPGSFTFRAVFGACNKREWNCRIWWEFGWNCIIVRKLFTRIDWCLID